MEFYSENAWTEHEGCLDNEGHSVQRTFWNWIEDGIRCLQFLWISSVLMFSGMYLFENDCQMSNIYHCFKKDPGV